MKMLLFNLFKCVKHHIWFMGHFPEVQNVIPHGTVKNCKKKSCLLNYTQYIPSRNQ